MIGRMHAACTHAMMTLCASLPKQLRVRSVALADVALQTLIRSQAARRLRAARAASLACAREMSYSESSSEEVRCLANSCALPPAPQPAPRHDAVPRSLHVSCALLTSQRVRCASQEEEDGPRPLTGFFFGNVTNRLRLQKDEGRYLGEARARRVCAAARAFRALRPLQCPCKRLP